MYALRTHLPLSFYIDSHEKNIPELSICISPTNSILFKNTIIRKRHNTEVKGVCLQVHFYPSHSFFPYPIKKARLNWLPRVSARGKRNVERGGKIKIRENASLLMGAINSCKPRSMPYPHFYMARLSQPQEHNTPLSWPWPETGSSSDKPVS